MAEKKNNREARVREILLNEKRRLWNELRSELFSDQDMLHTQFEIPQDIGDMSSIDLLEDTELAVSDIARQKLSRMDAAERKLAEGTYGMCEDCGEEIDEERMRVQPYAIRCINCQEKLEGPSYPPAAKM